MDYSDTKNKTQGSIEILTKEKARLNAGLDDWGRFGADNLNRNTFFNAVYTTARVETTSPPLPIQEEHDTRRIYPFSLSYFVARI